MTEDNLESLQQNAKISKYAAILMVVIGVLTIGSVIGDLLFIGGLFVALYWYFTQSKIDKISSSKK